VADPTGEARGAISRDPGSLERTRAIGYRVPTFSNEDEVEPGFPRAGGGSTTQKEKDMPSPEEIRAAMERYVELVCEGDSDGIADLYADDATVEDPVGENSIQGREVIRSFYAAVASNLQVEITGPICVAGKECATPLLAEFTSDDQKNYIDVIDVMTFDDEGKITSMRAFWNAADMRTNR
jgi:steroid delta-isomerase